MDVSIVIVNYNTLALLEQCITSILEKTHSITFEIIVVDNNSTEEGIDQLAAKLSSVCVVKSSVNLGFGKANNLGYTHAKGKYLFLLNPDTLLINNAVKILYDFLNEHTDIAIVGGQLYDLNGDINHSYQFDFPSVFSEINMLCCNLFTKIRERKFRTVVKDRGYGFVSYVTGADLMLRRCDIENYGLFHPSFFMYFEETELCKRFSRFNKKTAFNPAAKIIHLEGKSFAFNDRRETLYFQGRKTYFLLVYNKFYYLIVQLIFVFSSFLAVVFALLLFKNKKAKCWFKRLKLSVEYF